MGDLGEALQLMHSARHRFTTLRGTLRVVTESPFVPTDERVSRIWVEWPDRMRIESEHRPYWPLLQVIDGELHRSYCRERGTTIEAGPAHLEDEMLDPSMLLATLRLELLGRGTVAGRSAFLLGGRDTSFPHRAELEHELAVDAERGILLRRSATEDGRRLYLSELVEVVFDEAFPAETFLYAAPEDEPPPQPEIDLAVYSPRNVTIEELGRLAAFAVFDLDLPEEWEPSATFNPDQLWPYPGERPSFVAECLSIGYGLRDASHELVLHERMVAAGPDMVDHQEWISREHDGRSVLVTEPQGSGTTVRVELKGTRIDLYSSSLSTDQVLQAVGKLRRVPS